MQYFQPSLSYHLSLRSLFLSIFERPFYTGFTVHSLPEAQTSMLKTVTLVVNILPKTWLRAKFP